MHNVRPGISKWKCVKQDLIINMIGPLLSGLWLEFQEKYCGKYTWKTSKIVAFVAWHIIPCVTMINTKSMHTVLVFEVIWLFWGPEPKTLQFSVGPNKRSFNTSVIQTNPTSLAVMSMLDVNIFFLVVNSHQTWTQCRTVWCCKQPRGACAACEVAVTTEVTPTWTANVYRR